MLHSSPNWIVFPNYQRLIDFLHKQGIPRYDVGTSGHAAPQHLKYVLERLKPSTFIPLHSFYPERLVPDHSRLFLPEYGVTYGIKQNKIIKKGYAFNSIVVLVLSTLGELITTILAAYAFSRINFYGKNIGISLFFVG